MIHLVIGGARSGKSRFAENQIPVERKNVHYIATAKADDDEMANRIQRHQAQRPVCWQLHEEPLQLASLIPSFSSKDTVLIDCMTLFLSNWLCQQNESDWLQQKEKFINALVRTPANLIIVSNEVGSGIVPLGELSRQFVDHAGWLNQSLASIAERVTLVVAGLPLAIKSVNKNEKKAL